MKDHVKPSLRSTPNHFILHAGTNDLNSDQTSAVIDLATSLKNNQHDVSVSNITLRIDNSKPNAKQCEVNQILSKLCHERIIYIIDNSKKIKPNHLNLNKNDSNILSRTLINEIFNWRVFDDNSSISIEGCNTSVIYDINKVGDCDNTLKPVRKDNLNELIFPHLNIDSIWNKFELLSERIKRNDGVLMNSEA